MTSQVYKGIPETMKMLGEIFLDGKGEWRTFTSGLSKLVLGSEVDEIEKLRVAKEISARILIQKRKGVERGKELLKLPLTDVGYCGFPVHIGVYRDIVYLLSLEEKDSGAILIHDSELASQVATLFDKRYSQSSKII